MFTREVFVSTVDEIYGLLGLANYAAFFIPSFEGDALTRPMLAPIAISLSTMVSEPTDFESRMMLLTCGAFFYIRKLNTSFSSSVLGSATGILDYVFMRWPGG